MRRPPLLALVALVASLAAALPVTSGDAASADPLEVGAFSLPFAEPVLRGEETDERCVEEDHGDGEVHEHCKPTAGSMALLPGGDVLYWNALEGTENIENGIALEFGDVAVNDQSRRLSFAGGEPAWTTPTPVDGGGTSSSNPLFPFNSAEQTPHNNSALFCSDLVHLGDGRLLAVGGTDYYADPAVADAGYGVAELEGTRNARLFDPATNTWSQAGDMRHGRWYPSLVTLPDGKVLAASGVTKLIKPAYPDQEPTESGRNVAQTETFDPATGQWSYNEGGDRSLPLYPRLHLLPNGKVFYAAAGQAFNPSGYGYDQATWNVAAVYDPVTRRWTDLGIPGMGTRLPGFRGSAFSIMLPLRPGADGGYDEVELLAAGGVVGMTPGSYVATDSSVITTLTAGDDGSTAMASRETASLNQPRWYGTGVLLPDGSVMAFSGADRDEVVGPGTGFPIVRAERFDPETERWEPMASAHQARTYHNTAILLADGRVLVGGHAPIPTGYGAHQTLPGGFSPNEGRDPTFEIYSPPYVFRDDRPEIAGAPDHVQHGEAFWVATPQAEDIESVMIARNTAMTHLIDGDQRMVELPVLARADGAVLVAAPPDGAVAPAGPYLLFVNRSTDDGPVPSQGRQIALTR